jgi:hypothetical protein
MSGVRAPAEPDGGRDDSPDAGSGDPAGQDLTGASR